MSLFLAIILFMKKITLLFCLFSTSVIFSQQTHFNKEALQDKLVNLDGTAITFAEVLKNHANKPILLDIWASWCKDCIAGFPDLKNLQKKHKDIDYVFLSLDKDLDRWKAGIKKYDLKGDHYYISSGWKGPLCSSIDLDWIPRYILINADGSIQVYKAITTSDNQLKNNL